MTLQRSKLLLSTAILLSLVSYFPHCKKTSDSNETAKFNLQVGDLVLATSEPGLRIREKASLKAAVTHIFPYKSILTVLKVGDKFEIIDKRSGTWIYVSHPQGKGYAFSGYLEKFAIPSGKSILQGHWQFPSDYKPTDYKVCVRNTQTKERICTDQFGVVTQVLGRFDENLAAYQLFHLAVPKGKYQLFAIAKGGEFLAVYDKYSICAHKYGLFSTRCHINPKTQQQECPVSLEQADCNNLISDRALLPTIEVKDEGKLMDGFDPLDYFEMPTKQFPELTKP